MSKVYKSKVCMRRARGSSRRATILGLALFTFLMSTAGGPVPAQGQSAGHPSLMSPHASPIAVVNGRVFVANTPADTVDVIDVTSGSIDRRVDVGVDPVGLAARPDGKEVWVTNHVSDSVSIIDSDSSSPTYLQVIATVQDFDRATKATRFDEPVGIAFAGNSKAFVALSSQNQIAVIDVAARQVRNQLSLDAQDPRALAVHGDRLYVIPFESNNQTQLSGCIGELDGDLCTFDARDHLSEDQVASILSLGLEVDIVRNPAVPDRDLYVFNTQTEELVQVVETLGTLLYGIDIDSTGRVFVTQTEARNDANGRAGTLKEGLAEMSNRAFLNRITRVDCGVAGCDVPQFIDLEPLPPADPAPAMALATPFGIQVSDDGSILVVTAAGSNQLFTVDAATGQVLGRTHTDSVPRGIALESAADGAPLRAWVLNAVANTVSVVDISNPADPIGLTSITLEDPTHPTFKRGRMAFNDARASTTGTFSCASCHPDGHTDQLLWILATPSCGSGAPNPISCASAADCPTSNPVCDSSTNTCTGGVDTGCDQVPPRTTIALRGLRDTAPFHWDGIPGDPYGGRNTANIEGDVAPNSDRDFPETSSRHLVDGSLATTMKRVGDSTVNDEGKPGALSAAERDDLAKFLLAIPYPPAQRRAFDNVLSSRAEEGFRLFHVEGDDQGNGTSLVCGDCHRMPFWVSTNTPGTGMDAPTWRGANDRWLILPNGRFNVIDLPIYRPLAEQGSPERPIWRNLWANRVRFDPVWDMVLEGSTGFSGSFARQITLNRASADESFSAELLDALELADAQQGVRLEGEGVLIEADNTSPLRLEFDNGAYHEPSGNRSWTRAQLLASAASGSFVGTLTARAGRNVDLDHPQPALWTLGPIEEQRGSQEFPTLFAGDRTMVVSGRHLQPAARLWVDGRRVSGAVSLSKADHMGAAALDQRVVVTLDSRPTEGMHLLQVQNPDGLFSNDFIFFVDQGPGEPCQASDTRICLVGGRFQVDIDWRTIDSSGPGRVVASSDDSGLFWFFGSENWELMIKVLNGCGINGNFWVFAAATTDVEYTLHVTDTMTGAMKDYVNPLGVSAAAITDTTAFSDCP